MRAIDTVLFDFDGTVMDTNNLIMKSWQHTFRTLAGREEDPGNIIKTFGEPLEYTLQNFFPDVPLQKAVDTYRSFHYEKFGELIELFPGMESLLRDIAASPLKMGLVTSRMYLTTAQGLEQTGIKDLFDVIVTAEDTERHKPDPAPVLTALDRLGSAPENAVMLGDTAFDIQCAKNAGVMSVLVSWSLVLGGRTAEDLGDAAPDMILERPDDLKKMIHLG